MNILAIIPARGGSKGIPRKNVRLLNDKPLISYAIKNAKESIHNLDVYVSTDDEEIKMVAQKFGSETIDRNASLAMDKITLDPVIYDAVNQVEKKNNKKYDIVITMQPTSPLLKRATLDNAIDYFIEKNVDTLISVVNKPHLSWKEENGIIVPNYEERLNRQQLPANYLETGAFVITKREYVTENSRLGKNISVFEVDEEESTDIDSYSDWLLSESILKKKKIILRCDGCKEIGMGHIYHCLSLAYHLTGHDITFVLNENKLEGIEKVKESFFKYETIKDDNDFYELLERIKPDIVVNDCLDTTEEYILNLKKRVKKVVTIEDLGTGAKAADVCINALYEGKTEDNLYSGEKYICLREEFLISNPITPKKEINNILVLFGGTDPSNLTKRLYEIAKKQLWNAKFTFITGIGYDVNANNIQDDEEHNIKVLNNVKNISMYMEQADIAITSQGRTVYELACIGIPSIVLAQNEREMMHTFATEKNGFVNLGLGKNVEDVTIEQAITDLINDYEKRKESNEIMINKNLKKGVYREVNLILE